MKKFDTGATRDDDNGKIDYEGFLSPLVLERYGRYMNKHRKKKNGTLRDSDNWQKGIPLAAYQKPLVRHLMQSWSVWRGNDMKDHRGLPINLEEALCGVIFNASGYLHELLKDEKAKE